MPEVLPFRSAPSSRQPKRRILATTLRELPPPAIGSIDYFDDMTPGLALRITANDARTWTLFYRDRNGRQKRLTTAEDLHGAGHGCAFAPAVMLKKTRLQCRLAQEEETRVVRRKSKGILQRRTRADTKCVIPLAVR